MNNTEKAVVFNMIVFIDANILISLFRISNTDLDEIEKLVSGKLVRRFQLITTSHVKNEYFRYRETAAASGIDAFSDSSVRTQFPPFARRYTEYSEIAESTSELKRALSKFSGIVRSDAENFSLHIDYVVGDYFEHAEEIMCDEAIFESAYRRMLSGNPPRKSKDNIGDSLNWEALLSKAPKGTPLAIVSSDGDWSSDLSRGKPKRFLQEEWSDVTGGAKLYYFSSLSSFAAKFAKDIKVGSEFSADFLVDELSKSNSFRRTHELIDALRSAHGLTPAHVIKIIEATEVNPQISRIAHDNDVSDFLVDLYEGFAGSLDSGSAERLQLLIENEN